MATVKTSELIGSALDWAVAKALGRTDVRVDDDDGELVGQDDFDYSTDWSQGGPIIEREDVAVWPDDEGGWLASANAGQGSDYHGPTPLIAAMRCLVAAKLGDEIEIPDELLEAL